MTAVMARLTVHIIVTIHVPWHTAPALAVVLAVFAVRALAMLRAVVARSMGTGAMLFAGRARGGRAHAGAIVARTTKAVAIVLALHARGALAWPGAIVTRTVRAGAILFALYAQCGLAVLGALLRAVSALAACRALRALAIRIALVTLLIEAVVAILWARSAIVHQAMDRSSRHASARTLLAPGVPLARGVLLALHALV